MIKYGVSILIAVIAATILLAVALPGGPASDENDLGVAVEILPAKGVRITDVDIVSEADTLVVTGRVCRRIFSGRGPYQGVVQVEIIDPEGIIVSSHNVVTDPSHLPRALSGARFSYRHEQPLEEGFRVRLQFLRVAPPTP